MQHFLLILSIAIAFAASLQSAQAMSDEEKSHLRRVNVYFNTIGNMEGDFIQIDPQGRESSGRFFLSRPGKIRFQYALPSPSAVLSNGTWVAIQDSRGKNVDRYPLASTPLKFLLRDRVDLIKDTAIQDIQLSDDILSVTMAAKKPITPGSLTLNFALPNYNLVSWSVLDAKGNMTRVVIGNLAFDKTYPKKLFRIVENRTYNPDTGRLE